MMRRPLAVAALVLLAACDVPTAAPRWDMTWNVPSQNTSLSVNTFLPTGVSANAGNTAFLVNVSNVTITQTLGADCAACAPLNGLTVPKPAFVGVGNGSATLPASVTAASLAGDTLSVNVTNGFDFDPIKPTLLAAGDTGWVVTTVMSGSTVIGKDSINGQTSALGKNGASITRKIPIAGTVNGAAGVTVTVTVDSPLGDPVTINTAQTISFTASVGTLQVSSATVNLGAATAVTPGTPTTVDLSGISNSIAKSVNSGFFILTISNPLGVAGNLTANFTGGGAPVSKALTLSSAATSTDTLNFTHDDLTSLLGYSQQLTFSGTVSGVSVTITPGQTLAVTSRLQINVETVSNQ
jgi:hypothetical protein